MKICLLFLSLMTTGVMANNIQCSPVDEDIYEWTLEIVGTKAAFFDNDTWSEASYTHTLEVYPGIDVYKGKSFTIQVQELLNSSGKIKAYLSLEEESLEFNCVLVQEEDLYYL